MSWPGRGREGVIMPVGEGLARQDLFIRRPVRNLWLPVARVASASAKKKKGTSIEVPISILDFGAPGAIRTPDPLVRSQVLYPAELRARCLSRGAELYLKLSFGQGTGRYFSRLSHLWVNECDET
ncbi:protein of unknown function [Denitratisoma oestradiolicum]|uniref:Uncharacterized protein n=1 Tax=Denitratisoma oestradiolicum TaxID=311182 RepID=A0A6S6XS01_9PROT|nr:protein of unknown function [Denitratisoma oestradiolicum]